MNVVKVRVFWPRTVACEYCCGLLFSFPLVYQPSKPDKTSVDLKSWIALECGATEKFSATGAYKENVPSAVYSNFDFMKTELESGWFAIKIEADDQDDYGIKNLTKVCFKSVYLQ